MKPGDQVSYKPFGDLAYVKSIDGGAATIWWPCPELGRHTRQISLDDLTLVKEGAHKGELPERKRDHHHDSHRIDPNAPARPRWSDQP